MLRTEPKTLEVINRTLTGQASLDPLLKQIGASDRLRTPHYWVSKLKRGIKPRKRELLKILVDKGIFNQEERQVLWFFTRECYPSRDDRSEREIRKHLHTMILRGETPDPRTEMLISLVWASGLTDTLFEREERKDARKKVKEIAKFNPIAQGVAKAIQGS
ncbi:MAG: GOLPH3/VPS74 family protein [Desulfitobacteriaceae bacterium]